MSKENAAAFIRSLETGDGAKSFPPEPTPSDIVTHGRALGFEFTEADLGSVLQQRLFAAQSLPLGWGWPVARRLGLVRS